MKGERRNIELEELFRSKLGRAEFSPGIAVRNGLMKKLAVREFLHFNLGRFNIYYLGGIVATGVAVAFLMLSEPGKPINTEPSQNQENPVIITDTTAVIVSGDQKDHAENTGIILKPSLKAGRSDVSSIKSGRSSVEACQIKELTFVDSVRKKEDAPNVAEKPVNADLRKIFAASFRASVTEGCVPLKVVFTNTSVSYDSCRWYFGDGGSSSAGNPEWVFDTPGTYRVTLNTFGTGRTLSSATAVVTVYAKPVARFEIQPINPASDDDMMQLINYSSGAVRYRWDLGDGTVVSRFEPVHRYDKSGKYNIKLTVWSEHGCVDSVTVVNATGRTGYYIKFPNAFIPNRGGPTGGYYSASSDAAANIFHPVFNGVADYQLRIFSRSGMLIFESNDINIGWDGYTKGNLCEPGVYIWKVRGTYKNGEVFVKMGDVTLLRGN